jgi:hypothetical protein
LQDISNYCSLVVHLSWLSSAGALKGFFLLYVVFFAKEMVMTLGEFLSKQFQGYILDDFDNDELVIFYPGKP